MYVCVLGVGGGVGDFLCLNRERDISFSICVVSVSSHPTPFCVCVCFTFEAIAELKFVSVLNPPGTMPEGILLLAVCVSLR